MYDHMDRIKIGKIVNVKGLLGEMKVYPYTDYMERFEELGYLYIEETRYEITKVTYHKGMPNVKLQGIDSIEEAQKYRNRDIYIDHDQTRQLDDDEFLIIDLIGIDVVDKSGKIGTLKDVLTHTSQDIYVVKTETKEILIPAVRQFVKKIDVENGFMEVELIEGL